MKTCLRCGHETVQFNDFLYRGSQYSVFKCVCGMYYGYGENGLDMAWFLDRKIMQAQEGTLLVVQGEKIQ